MDEKSEDEDFNLIQPTLIQQLKNILDQYPDNGQILKEIIQNAEDAGAKEVRFLYDENETSTIFGQGIDELQGPSLYSYNDAYFRKDDWTGIRMFGKSLKEKDPLKVGRFGLGFKSTFHLTDNPTIMSGKTLGIINPDENLFSSGRERRTGKVFDFDKQPLELKNSKDFHQDHSDVYKDILGTDVSNGKCSGSLFRFKLRKEPSELSKTIYGRDKVMELFNSFKGEGHLALIFMKNLEKIEFFIRKKGESTAELVSSFSIDDTNQHETCKKKEEFVRAVEQAQAQNCPLERSVFFQTTISAKEWENGRVKSETMFSYSVVHHFAGGTLLEDGAMTKIAEEIGLMPLVGIAHPRNQDLPTGGHVFCTLPLPVLGNALTSLPVHINGFFALGPDRKDLKWPSVSEIRSSDKQVLWNQFLLQKALSSAYEELFRNMTSLNLPKDVIYSLYPVLSIVDKKWMKLAEAFFQQIFRLPCLWTRACDGKWILPSDAIFEKFKEKQCVGLDVAFECLVQFGVLAVKLPRHVEEAFSKLYDGVNNARHYIKPKMVRRVLKNWPGIIDALTCEKRMQLLSYIVSAVEDVNELLGVAVLPLENGSFAAVKNRNAEKILIPSINHPKDLLPGLEGKLLKTDINAGLLSIFKDAAKQGKYQLAMLSESTVAELIKDVISYNKSESTIKLKYSANKPTTAEWLRNIWQYARKFNLLLKLDGLPLIPLENASTEKQVLRCAEVTNQSSILFLSDSVDYGQCKRNSWASFMSFLGFKVVTELPEYILEYNELFRGKINKYNAADITSLFVNMSQIEGLDNFVRRFRMYKDNEVKNELKELIGNMRSWLYHVSKLIKKLPIFENSLTKELVSVEEVRHVAPQNMPLINPRSMLIRCNDATSRNLADKLGAELLTKRTLINDVIIPEMLQKKHDNQSIDEFMKYILPDVTIGHQFPKLEDIPFVTATNGNRYKPGALFDPDHVDLRMLFSHENGKFPSGMYKDEPFIQALRKLGLKSARNLSAEDLHQIINSIPLSGSPNEGQQKAKLLVEYFEKYPNAICSGNLEFLRNSPWIPVMQARPIDYPKKLTWHAERYSNQRFERPTNMTCEANARILGAVMPIFSNEYSTNQMKKYIFQLEVKLPDILKQLKCVINNYEEQYKAQYVLVVQEIYRHLSEFDKNDVEAALSSLHIEDWAWNGKGFTCPKKMVVTFDSRSLNLSPYIWRVPLEMRMFEDMLLKLGANKACTIQMEMEVLKEMKVHYEKDTPEDDETAALTDLKLAVEIISRLSKKELPANLREQLLVPIHTKANVLKFELADNTVYCPNYSHGSYDYEFHEDVNYLHERIDENVATALGIRSLTSKILGAEDLGIFEEYGQTEPLTRRINRILQDYGDGSAIIKELIQNADDAGATEVKLLYDERQNRNQRSSLIDPGMQDFQGPALWAYNNATFSKQDFDNITKLSGATKESQRDKIGKFGLGFNAVYNITDVPSFISKDQLVIFDPHTTNLGRAISNKSKPGVKINIGSNRNRLKHFKDQLTPYHGIFGMDMSLEENHQSFNGTLFRFPLRTKQQAIQSEIKKLCYDQHEMKKLLSKFAAEANKILLFTQHVHRIEVFYLEENAVSPVEMKELVSVEKDITKEIIPLVIDGRKFKASEVTKLSAVAVDKARQVAADYKPIICSNILGLTVNISSSGREYFKDQHLKDSNDKWLVRSASDSSDSKCFQMAFEHSKLNPVASIAISVSDEDLNSHQFAFNALDTQGREGHFFCFLPLPIANMLPVHVNGTFAVTHDRKSMQQVNEDDKYVTTNETRWNHALMAGPVSAAYLGALEDLKKIAADFEERQWYELFPTAFNVYSPYNKSLLKSFYENMIVKRPKLLHACSTKQWIHWGESIIIDKNLDEDIRRSMESIIQLYVKDRFVIHLPDSVIKSMSDAGFTNELKQVTMTFEEFFSNVFQPNIKEPRMPANVRDNVVLYLIKNLKNYPKLRSALIATECIPTLPNGKLKSPNKLVRPKSNASTLYEESDEVFPAGERFNQRLNLEILEELGMVADKVPWEILESRAHTVVSLENQVTARSRSKCLINRIDEKIKQNGFHEISDSWRSIKFLPVKAAPKQWCDLPWAGTSCDDKFHSIEGIYPSSLENLVCCHSPIIDESEEGCGKLSKEILEFFKIPTKAMLSQVCDQIDKILDVNLVVVKDPVKEILVSIYRYLDSYCKKKNPEGFSKVRSRFENKPFLVIGNKLVQMKFVAFRHDYLSEPYLYKLPYNLTLNFRALMSAIGVKESFDLEDFIHALQCMENDYRNKQLQDAQIKMVRNILESIDSFQSEESLPLFLPDNKGILYSNHDVHVKDARWIPDDPNLRYIHPDIPDGLALSLGAKTVRSHSISKHSIGMPFGQHEKLTVRLKKILDGYPSDLQIFHEILQNADDAGATKLQIVLDRRTHPNTSVFSDAWKSLQGPAILFCNNAPFTESDLQGIQNLGEGSKSNDPLKTGQFGVGFNVVYHVTDVPMLLTHVEGRGSVLCIFDPHAKFLDECTLNEPGRMFSDARNFLKKQFPDVYRTFVPDVFSNLTSTIFRLPIRDINMALESKIKQEAISVDNLREMLDEFQKEAAESMLFLKHVETIELSEIKGTGHEKLYSIHSKCSPAGKNEKTRLNEEYKSIANTLKENLRDSVSGEFAIHSYDMIIRDSKKSQKWHIIQKNASVNSSSVPPSVEEHYKKGLLRIFPSGGIACKQEEKSTNNGKVFCLLPLQISSSLPLHINGNFILDYETRRKLWFSSKDNCFQNDWNYYVIENCVIPSYIALLENFAKQLRIDLGDSTAEEVIKRTFPKPEAGQGFHGYPLYPSRIEDSKERMVERHPKEIHRCFSNFPVLISSNRVFEYDSDLVKKFYKQLAEGESQLFPVLHTLHGGGQLTINFCPANSESKQLFIPDACLSEGSKLFNAKEIENLCFLLLKAGMHVYNVPRQIVRSFDESEVPLKRLNPLDVIKFLKGNANAILSSPMPVSNTKFKDVETVGVVLKYCLTLRDVKIEDLEGLPLLVTEDNYLRTIDSNSLIYFEELSELFPTKSFMSLHPKLRCYLGKYQQSNQGWLRRLTLEQLNEFLHGELDPKLKSTEEIELQGSNVADAFFPTKKWLIHLWDFLRKEHKRVCEEHRRKEDERKHQLQETYNYKKWRNYYNEIPEPNFKDFLQKISEWCLLPVKRRRNENIKEPYKKSLMKVGSISSIVSLCLMSTVGDALGLPCLDESAVDMLSEFIREGENAKYIKEILATENDPEAFLTALYIESKRENSGFQRITCGIANKILEYYNDRCITYPPPASTLKTLKLFEDISGQLQALSSDKDAYRVPHEMPKAGIESLQGVVFLKDNCYLQRLYDHLGIKEQDLIFAYVKHIFPFFSCLTQADRLEHLEFLRRRTKDVDLDDSVEELLKHLKRLAFIESKDGNLHCANHFYDPEEIVFKLLLPEDKFPSKPFCEKNWLPFIRKCGLITSVSPDLFLQFARGISQIPLTSVSEKEIKKKSQVLVEYLFGSEDLTKDIFFLHQLSSIEFLLQDCLPDDLKQILSKSDRRMICFKGAVIDNYNKFLGLAWSVENMLPSYASMHFSRHLSFCSTYKESEQVKKSLKENLLVKESVPYLSVARNLVNIVTQSKLLLRKSLGVQELAESGTSFERVIGDSYDSLAESESANNSEAISLLKENCVILVKNGKIVIPKKTTLDENSEILPYLFSVPVKYGKYFDFFQTLGTTKQATCEQLADVLCQIHASTDGKALSPNEASAVFKASSGLSRSLQTEEPTSLNADLYLPGKMSADDNTLKLYNSKDIVYFDDKHFEERLRKLKRPRMAFNDEEFKEDDLRKLVSKLPQESKPIYISKIITEKLLEAEDVPNSDFAEKLQSRIQCEEFIGSMIRLLMHQSMQGSEDIEELPESVEIIKNTRVSTLKEVKTALYDSDEIIESSEDSRDLFVIENDGVLNFYVAQDKGGSFDGLNISIVARELSIFFREFLTDPTLTPLINGLLSCRPEEMQSFLDTSNIRRSNQKFISNKAPNEIGEFVPAELHFLLVNDIVEFENGEYVAYEAEDPQEDNNDGDAVYIYARIVEKCSEFQNYYKIEYFPAEFKRVHCSEIYRFERQDDFASALVPHSGDSETSDMNYEQDLAEMLNEITREIEKAYKEDKDYFRKFIKRLYLRWHPDKNPGREEFCKKVFQHIQNEAERLEKMPDNFFTQFFNRGTRFGKQRRNFKSSGSHYSWFGSSGSQGFWRSSSGARNPQPGEARRWHRQAKHDFEAAKNDLHQGPYEWVCFKCHQAAEKGLKAAVYTVDAKRTNDHNLRVIAQDIDNSDVRVLASKLESLLGSSTKLRYPDQWHYPAIPHTQYSRETAFEALEITEKLMKEINEIVR